MKITLTALFLLSAIFSMGQSNFTARTWEAMDRAIYRQQRQIDSLLDRTKAQDRELHDLERGFYANLQGSVKILNTTIEQGIQVDSLMVLLRDERTARMLGVFNARQENALLERQVDSLIKDLRDRPALRIGLQEGPVFRDPPIWQDGWPRQQILEMDSAGHHIIRVIDRNPVIFYNSPTGDSLYQWGRDPSFPRGSIQPLSGEGYDTGVTVIDPTTTPSLSQDIIKKGGHRKKHKIKISQPVIDFSIDQGSTIGKPTFSGLTMDTIYHRGKEKK